MLEQYADIDSFILFIMGITSIKGHCRMMPVFALCLESQLTANIQIAARCVSNPHR
jgi:hypothetical protein